MKHIKSFRFITALVILFFSSCSKNFLEKNPTDELSQETFYTSKNSIDMALTSCYATMQDIMYTTSLPILDCLTDNGYIGGDYHSCTNIARGPITSTLEGYISDIYDLSFQWIAQYNIFLQQLSKYDRADISPAQKLQYEAEARLLRAMKYFELYKYYGDVPLVTEPLVIENKYQPSVDAPEILAQINSDLDFAIANLPDISYASASGHFVKSFAQGIKARVLLFDAYNPDGSAKADIMQQVKDLTGSIINNHLYSIAASYRGLFCDDLGQQEGNPEFLFSVKFLPPNNVAKTEFGWSPALFYIVDQGTVGGKIAALKNFADEYQFIDGTPFSETNPLYDPANVYNNRDPRMAMTLFSTSTTFENGYTFTQLASPTGYTYRKQIEGTDAQNSSANNCGSDWPVMRYAEVLLMYAEAANETDGPTADVYNSIDQIRSRPDVNIPDLPAGLTKDLMRAAIRSERRIELSFEGFRYDDLKRWKIAVQTLNIPASEGIAARSFEEKNYHWPLPQSEIDENNGVLQQNPDYN